MIVDLLRHLIFGFGRCASNSSPSPANSRLARLVAAGFMPRLRGGLCAYKEREHRVVEEREMASTNIYIELRDILDGLNRDAHSENAMSFRTKDGQKMFFMNRIFNRDFYDSLIFSGKISFLKPDLQQNIRSVFRNIREHNEVLKKAVKIKDGFGIKIPPEAYEHYIWMDGCEQELMEAIPKIS